MITINFKNTEYLPAKLLYFMVYEYLEKRALGKVEKGRIGDFGNYGNAQLLGWGFKDAHTYKKYLHTIFRNNEFYPDSMIVKKSWVKNNKETVNKFINNRDFVVKPDRGQSGNGISRVRDAEGVVGRIDDNFWILQRVVEPRLYEGRKFDIRIFHFILRYGDNYYNILTKCGVVKTSVKKYTKSMDGFLTNIMHNNKIDKSTPHLFNLFDFMNKLEKNEDKRKEIIVRIYDCIRQYSQLLCNKLKENTGSKAKAQMMLYGPDIILDKDNKVYLLETNCSPGILIKSEVNNVIEREMLVELMDNVVTPILQSKKIDLDEYKGKLLFIEKLS